MKIEAKSNLYTILIHINPLRYYEEQNYKWSHRVQNGQHFGTWCDTLEG
jgi:hypothetical protein